MRFYFDFVDGADMLRDNEGLEVSGAAAAPKIAALTLVDMAKDITKTIVSDVVENGSEVCRHLVIHVRDCDGPVMQVRLTFSLDVQQAH